MDENNLPVGPAGDDARRRLPASVDHDAAQSLTEHRPATRSLEALSEEHGDAHGDIDLLAYWQMLVKRRWLVLGVLLSVTAASLLLTLLATPIYRASVVMQIDNEEQQVVQVGGVSTQAYDPQFQQTQYELLQSRALAERVAEELKVTAADGHGQSAWLGRLRMLVSPTPATDEGGSDGTLRESAGVVQRGLSIEPVRNSRLVRVNFDSPSPEFSSRVANAVAEGFIASGLERRFGASSYAKTYLEEQLKLVKARLEQSERQLVAFAQKENLVSTSEGQSLAGQNLSELNSALATAQEQRIRAQARWGQAQAASGAALPADMLGNSIVRTLQEQRAQLQGEYQQKLQVFKADYPEMLQLKSRMDELDKQVSAELANIRASVRAEYNAAASQERLLQGQLGTLRTQALDVDGRSIQYNILKREVDTNRELYDGLLQRYKEVGVAGDVRTNNISIIDRAQVPTVRFKPNLGLNLAIGLLLGLTLGVLAALVVEFFDDTLKSPADIEQRLKLAVLGIIPKLSKHSPGEAAKDPRSAFSESYRSVRTALQFSTDNGVPRVLLITSAVAGEGKSTSALTLARNFAQMGKRTLLIDGDLRNPSLHKTLGMHAEIGLSNLLAGGRATLFESVLSTGESGLDVILSGPLPPNPAELLSSSRLVSLLAIGAQSYDQVIIDGPPIMGIADAPILANAADATLLVVLSGKTRIATAQAGLKRLRSARAYVLGSVLTQFDAKAAGYGYSYAYEGYYDYGNAPRLNRS